MKVALTSLSLMMVALLGSAARGEVRTFAMEGTVNSKYDPVGKLTFADVGSPVVFTFAVDSNASDTNLALTLGEYCGLSSEVLVNSTHIVAGQPFIIIQHPTDMFSVRSQYLFQDFIGGQAVFSLLDHNDAIPGTELPSVPYDLSLFSTFFSIGFDVPNPGQSSPLTLTLTGPITSFLLLPEPSSIGLLGFGLLFLRTHGP